MLKYTIRNRVIQHLSIDDVSGKWPIQNSAKYFFKRAAAVKAVIPKAEKF
jgi:hypothetical protein